MKNRFLYIPAAFLLVSVILFSCEKNAVQNIDIPNTNGAKVKFFNFGINAPVVNFFLGDTKISAAVSTTGVESGTTGVAYSAVFPATNNYSLLPAGTYDIKAKRPSTATADPNLAINTLNTKLDDGSLYSLYLCGLYNATAKTSDAFIIKDDLPAIDTSGAYVRFVHTSYNANPFNLVMKNTTTGVETTVATNIAYKSGSTYAKLPSGVYDLQLRYPATPTVNTIIRTGVSLLKANVYSFSLRGDITLPYTGTATNRPFIDNTPNR